MASWQIGFVAIFCFFGFFCSYSFMKFWAESEYEELYMVSAGLLLIGAVVFWFLELALGSLLWRHEVWTVATFIVGFFWSAGWQGVGWLARRCCRWRPQTAPAGAAR